MHTKIANISNNLLFYFILMAVEIKETQVAYWHILANDLYYLRNVNLQLLEILLHLKKSSHHWIYTKTWEECFFKSCCLLTWDA